MSDSRDLAFKIHFEKREIDHLKIDINKVGLASDGFSGSEIKQVVVSAIYACHASSAKVTTAFHCDGGTNYTASSVGK